MTVAELIAKLQEMPQDARVVVNGYEGGLDDVTQVVKQPIVLNRNERGGLYGAHEDWEEGYDEGLPEEIAVFLPRLSG